MWPVAAQKRVHLSGDLLLVFLADKVILVHGDGKIGLGRREKRSVMRELNMRDGVFRISKRMQKTVVQADRVHDLQVAILEADHDMGAVRVELQTMNLIALVKSARTYEQLLLVVPQL